jgi:tetratricopeptide (TPR) repeat protein
MDNTLIQKLLEDLKNPNESIRKRATYELWRLWFHQKGVYGLQLLEQSQALMQSGDMQQAELLLSQLVQDQPDFAEAWNRRAVLYYLREDYHRAIADCQQVITLNPIHFGALHGLGLCHMAVGNYSDALQAFRQALAIQPHAVENQRMILECTALLS